MKKIIYILTILCSFLVFQSIFSEVASDQYTKVYNFFDSFAEEKHQQILNIVYELGTDEDERIERYHALLAFVNKEKCTTIFSYGMQGKDYKSETLYYLYTQENIDDLAFYNTLHNSKLDFSKPTMQYISSDYSDDKAYDHIAFIDSDYGKANTEVIQLRQLSSYPKDFNMREDQGSTNISLYIYILSDDKYTTFEKIKNDTIGSYLLNEEEDIATYEGLEFPKIDTTFSYIIILFVIIALILLLICQIFKKKKEILIRKMMGQSNGHIFRKIFLPQILCCATLYCLIQFIAYYFIIGNVNSIQAPLLKNLLVTFCVYLGFLMLTCILTYGTILLCRSSSAIKRRGDIGIISYGSLFLKMIFLTLIITPFLGQFYETIDALKEKYYLEANKDTMKHYITIYGIKREDNPNASSALLTFFKENGGIYQDFGKNYENEIIMENALTSVGKLLYPYIVVNREYLKDYTLKDENQNRIEINNRSGNILLVPKKYKGSEIYQYCDSSCNTMYIENGYSFKNHNPFTVDNYSMLVKKDPIILVTDDYTDINSDVLFYKETHENVAKLKSFMKKHNLENTVFLTNTSNAYKVAVNKNQATLKKVCIIMALYFVLTLVYQFQSIYIYYIEHKHEFVINYLLGKNFFQRYTGILSINVLLYMTPFLYGIAKAQVSFLQLTTFIILAIGVDFIIFYVMIRFLEKHSVVSVLKGENE